MEERDLQILRHLGLYYLSLRLVIEARFFAGNKTACGNVLTRLQQQKRIVARARAFPGGISYYQLTPATALALGFPEYRAKAPAGQALPEKLATLWFCTMNEAQRTRAERAQLTALFQGTVFPGAHCVERRSATELQLLRLFTPSADDEYLLRQVRAHLEDVQARGFYDWLQTKKYGVALLTETAARRDKLLRQLERTPLTPRAAVVVEVCPLPETLKEMMHAYAQRTQPGPPDPGGDAGTRTGPVSGALQSEFDHAD